MPRIALPVLATLLLAAPAAHAANGSFAGTLGVKVPKGATATVQAVDVARGRIVAARDTSRTGAFSLSLPPGAYTVQGAIVRPRGAVIRKAVAVNLRSGQKRRGTKLTARRRRAPAKRRPRFVTERGNAQPGTVAVGLYYLDGPATGELSFFKKGLADLLTTDVLNISQSRCPGRVALREVNRLDDVLREFELGKSPYADKSTFPERNLIELDVAVRGTMRESATGNVLVDLQIVDARTGKTIEKLSADLGNEEVFDGEQRLAETLTDKLCKLAPSYEVTLDVAGRGEFATHRASGTIHQELIATRSGDTWTASGPLSWADVAFTSKTECAYIAPVIPATTWSVKLTIEGEQLRLSWGLGGPDATTASVDCPPDGSDYDPPPIAGQPGPSLVNTGPGEFLLPVTGATQPINGVIADGGDGFFNSGTMRIRPLGIVSGG